MLIDSHCHLDYLARDEDVAAVMARARQAGVERCLTISTKLSTFETVRGIAEQFEDVWCTVGVHPHEAEEEGQETPARLLELADHPEVIGIGETGLDYYYENSPREAQRESFRTHIAAAREAGLPVIVHTRDADEDTVAILHDEYQKGAFTGLIHCFSTSAWLAEKAMEIGFLISISGIVTFKRSEALREAVAAIPVERLLVETDSPYLAPVPYRGKTNEPAYVVHTANCVAELKGLSTDALARATGDNFFRLFTKAAGPAEGSA